MLLRDDQIEQILAPITPGSPGGSNARYDPAYERVKEARREDDDIPQGELKRERKLAEPAQVIAEATTLLATTTKDLQLAVWLTEALLKRDGFAGLAQGLALLTGLIETFWDTLHPALEDGDAELRVGPLEWVGARLDVPAWQVPISRGGYSYFGYQQSRRIPTESEAGNNQEKRARRERAVEERSPLPEAIDRDVEETPKGFYQGIVADLTACDGALTTLEVACGARFGPDAPSFTRLRGALDEVRRFAGQALARKSDLDPDPAVEAPANAPPVVETAWATGTPTPAANIEGAPGPVNGATGAAAEIAAAARSLRVVNPTSPAPYLVLRALRWGELRTTPGYLDPKLLEAPPTSVRARLKGLLLDGRWSELLEQGEGVMAAAHGRGWLDLQRYTITACAQLGAAYDAVASGVRAELGTLLDAAPGLPDMTMMDDTPTANAETRAWLRAAGLTPIAAASARGHSGGAADAMPDGAGVLNAALAAGELGLPDGWQNGARDPAPRDVFVRARAEADQGRPNRGIELLAHELARERSPRGRFIRETQIAGLMVGCGLERVAQPLLERLLEQIEERKLDEWEAGALVAQPMILLCRCIDKLDGDRDGRHQLYLRVCRLDPLQAIALQATA